MMRWRWSSLLGLLGVRASLGPLARQIAALLRQIVAEAVRDAPHEVGAGLANELRQQWRGLRVCQCEQDRLPISMIVVAGRIVSCVGPGKSGTVRSATTQPVRIRLSAISVRSLSTSGAMPWVGRWFDFEILPSYRVWRRQSRPGDRQRRAAHHARSARGRARAHCALASRRRSPACARRDRGR